MKEKNNKNKKDLIIIIIITVLVVLLVGFNIFSYYSASLMLPGKPLPFISGIDPEKNNVSTIDLGNGTFIVNFWATWCGACVSEIESLNKIASKYTVYGVLKKPFKKEVYDMIKPAFKNVLTEDDFFNDYYVSVIPTTVLVKNGVIKEVHTGTFSQEIAEKWFSQSDD